MKKIVLDFVGGWAMLLQNQFLINDAQRCELVRQLYQRLSPDLLSLLRWTENPGLDFTLLYPNPALDPVYGSQAEKAINDTLSMLAIACHTQAAEHGLFNVLFSHPDNIVSEEFPFGLEHVTPTFLLLVMDSSRPLQQYST